MEFSEALVNLKAGKKIRRTSWSEAELYVFEVSNYEFEGEKINPFMLIKTTETPSLSMFQPNSCEVLADDWEVL